MIKLFGFTLGKKESVQTQPEEQPALVLPQAAIEDGAVTITQGAYYGTYVDLEGSVRNELELVSRYREMSLHPECAMAIDDIVTEAISQDTDNQIVKINLEQLKQSETIKKKIEDEFEEILHLLNFKNIAEELFRRWYVDGRLYFHIMVDENKPKEGIQELRFIDPRKIRKVREVLKQRDSKTGVEKIGAVSEYYVFNDRGMTAQSYTASVNQGVRIATDSIVYVPSGMLDAKSIMVISHLHKAIKPLNQLRMIEDAVVIYRLSRAPERRIFYIDVGNLPKLKAEQYVHDIMVKYRNKLVYDACLAMDTKIPLLDGRTLTLQEITDEFQQGKRMWAYSCDPVTGQFAPGLITNAAMTRPNAEVLRLTLDNGKTIICTPDHKFPVWGKGFVEAKDLVIGESMVPLYRRHRQVSTKTNEYEQLFHNDKKRWEFTHRTVSDWKDSHGLLNEESFLSEYEHKDKHTIHHKNYDRFDNTPENLTRMNRDDHFELHRQFCSLAGKIGGKVTAQKRKAANIPQFNLTHSQRQELGKKYGAIGGRKAVEAQAGIHGLTQDEIIQNAHKGSAALQEKLKNEEFNATFRKALSEGWSEESKHLAAERGRHRSPHGFGNNKGNVTRWKHNREVNIQRLSESQTIKYPPNCFDILSSSVTRMHNLWSMKVNDAVQILNDNEELRQEFEHINSNNARHSSTQFKPKDIPRICEQQAGISWQEFKEQCVHRNHKIVGIEYLIERMDTGTLEIDGNEQYHGHHTFALDAGIYTKNSTGEIRDERKHLSMLEDFWLPRREGSLEISTKIPLLDGRTETLEHLIVEHKLGKQNWTYSVSPEGKIVPGKITWAGVTGYEKQVVKVTLDNGETITATPEHEFILRTGVKCRAEDLLEGTSLMPCYTREKTLSAKTSGQYHQVYDVIDEKWKYTHRVVSECLDRKKTSTEVIHHKDFNRYNNNPENLQIMDKQDHFALHSTYGTRSWDHSDYDQHCQRLSESGKAFFLTEEGKKRKEEIAHNNKINPNVIEGCKKGRELIIANRKLDKERMSKEDYLNKWSPGLAKMQQKNEQIVREKQQFFETQFENVCRIVDTIFHRTLTLEEVCAALSTEYPQIHLHSPRVIRDLYRLHGHTSFNSYLATTYGSKYKYRNAQTAYHNHKVVSVEWMAEPADVGTLTIDEHHEYHDYHNFALSSGIFVMNSKGTEITTLPPGQNLGELEDVIYFRKKLYQSLNVPITRLDDQNGGGLSGLGRAAEITRDEVKFFKFIQRLRRKFAQIFDDTLRVQLSLKGVCTVEEWNQLKQDITYDFMSDNHYYELRDAEVTQNRIAVAAQIEPFVGTYYSQQWVKRHVLRMTEEEIEAMQKELDKERKNPPPIESEPMDDVSSAAPSSSQPTKLKV